MISAMKNSLFKKKLILLRWWYLKIYKQNYYISQNVTKSF
jgi:hypothetical protein